jgi:hypothetical protein
MGLLDDAIREHLDLKRRRGADPAEVERAEREALGPVRREPEEGGAGEPALEDAPGALDELEYEEPEGSESEYGPEDDRESPAAGAAAGTAPVAAPDPSQPDPLGDPFADDDDDPFAEPEPRAPFGIEPKPERGAEPVGEQTVEYNVEDALKEPGHEDEDPLEETPEFLQDAPEHDRLWFEQRPPRDFDFDG